jgi:hypothetical protein
MSKVLDMMARAAIIMLGLATVGSANARAISSHHNHVRPGYAGWASHNHPGYAAVYSSAPDAHFVPGRGIVDDSCDLPTSPCPNDERIAN